MAAAVIALSCAKGEAVTFALTHTVSATDSTAKNITGWAIKFMARDETGLTVIDKTATIVSGAAGTYTVALTHADSLILPKGYDADVWRTDSGSETIMATGKLTITPEVRYP